MKTSPFWWRDVCGIEETLLCRLFILFLVQCEITPYADPLRCFYTATCLTIHYWVLKLLHFLILAGPAANRRPSIYNLSPFYVNGENNYKWLLTNDICIRLKKIQWQLMSIRMAIGAHFVVATVGAYLGWEMWNKGSNHLKCNFDLWK